MFPAASDSIDTPMQAEQHQHRRPQRLGVESITLRLQPAACGKHYWHWRYQRDVLKLDFACAVMTVCRVAASAYACTAPLWCLALMLMSALLQLTMIRRRPLLYARLRLVLVCLARLAWMCFSCYALHGIHAPAFATSGLLSTPAAAAEVPGQHPLVQHSARDTAAATAAAAGRQPGGEVAVLFAAASWLANLALQPLLQPVPFVLQVPLQALEAGLLLTHFNVVAVRHVEALPGLAAAMHRLHALCEGMFHVGTGFVFLTPKVLAGCSPDDLRLVANCVVVYAGLALPLFLLYKAELLGKARFALSRASALTRHAGGAGAAGSNGGGPGGATAAHSSSHAAAAGAAAAAPGAQHQAGDDSKRDGVDGGCGGDGGLRLQLTGCVQPISHEFLLQMLRCPRVRLQDDVICGMLLLLLTWGLCLFATPRLW
ncbi:hypothetical protein COO60DRAFT_181367 [Scenedesmus sp. NREL 46B-D3]|nr:hypothetical protein COO60DRAFT_181367 [Scenedesmus sp. NREL 46B-D3]